jgi:transposase
VVSRLCAVRGIATLTGLGLAVEIGDWDRFTGSSIGAYLGLVPSESSSGASRVQGPITKTGNTHVRRLLVEAAWQHQRPLRAPGKALSARRAVVSPRCGPGPWPPTGDCINAGNVSRTAGSDPRSSRWP